MYFEALLRFSLFLVVLFLMIIPFLLLGDSWCFSYWHKLFEEAFNLDDGEERFIVNARIGQETLAPHEKRLPFY